LMMNPVPWLQMTNMISYQGLVRTFPNMLAHMETQNKIYNILTPEQKKQFNANFEKRLTERPAAKGKMPATAE
ncbi:Spy/CpxP family protein refolding chaperone, partial [Escherichia coli]|uniref:Spy/CpxP family protein refolding chaperone n=1 Tax=Escherichia coli TaxID=562 RepID=UPI001FCED7D1